MSPGWSTSWIEAANNAAVISNGVNTDCNIIDNTSLMMSYRREKNYNSSDISILPFTKNKYLALINGKRYL